MSAPKTYQWSNPGEWLESHVDLLLDRVRVGGRQCRRTAALDLAALARTLGRELDADQIQDLFQDAMEEDGYFRKT